MPVHGYAGRGIVAIFVIVYPGMVASAQMTLGGFYNAVSRQVAGLPLGRNALLGAIANLIVADLAHKSGVRIDWRMHAQVGVPVTLLTLAVVWASLKLQENSLQPLYL